MDAKMMLLADKFGDAPLTGRSVGAWLDALADEVLRAFQISQARIAALGARVKELESNGIKYCGTYQRAAGYKRGDRGGRIRSSPLRGRPNNRRLGSYPRCDRALSGSLRAFLTPF